MKPLSKKKSEEVRKKALAAIDAGRVEFSNPKAPDMFPIGNVEWEDAEFSYFDASVIPHTEFHDGGIHFQWGIKGFGFGEASVVWKDGKWIADTERLGREFLVKLLTRWAKQMKVR